MLEFDYALFQVRYACDAEKLQQETNFEDGENHHTNIAFRRANNTSPIEKL